MYPSDIGHPQPLKRKGDHLKLEPHQDPIEYSHMYEQFNLKPKRQLIEHYQKVDSSSNTDDLCLKIPDLD